MMESKKEEESKPKKSWKSAELKLSFSISPMTKWILTILILGIGVVLVVVFYAQEQARNTDLKDEVGTATTNLIQKSLEKKAFEDRLALANLTLAELAVQFPSARQSMDVEEALFSGAADAGVTVESVNCPAPQTKQVDKISYEAFGVSISLIGDTDGFLRFVGRLGYWLPSAAIESVSIREDSMSINLLVYAGVGE